MRRWDIWLLVVALAAVALWMDLSRWQRHQNGDTVLMSLVSLEHWTPLFWEQDRLGMLIPALAIPFRSPLGNLLAQGAITTFASLATFFLLGYYAGGRRRGLSIGALGAMLFVLLQREWKRFNYFIYIHQFATSLSLSLAALLALDQWQRRGGAWRLGVAIVGLWLALWVNPSIAFAVGPLILCARWLRAGAACEFDRQDGCGESHVPDQSPSVEQRRFMERGRFAGLPASDWLGLAFTASGLAVSMAISRLAATAHQPYALLAPGEWAACALGVARDLPGQLDSRWFWAILAAAASGLLPLAWPAGRASLATSARVGLALLLPAAAQYAFITSLDHVHRTDFGHYAFASVILWQAACLSFCVLQWAALVPSAGRAAWAIPWGLVALFAVAAAARHGRPGIDVARAALAEGIGKYAPDVLAARASHVMGGYTDVWTTVFYANLTLADQGSPKRVWGIASRALPTADRWTATPLEETRIAEIIGEESEARAALEHYGVPPLEPERDLATIHLKRPTVALSAARVAPRRAEDIVVRR